jgi:hypothetical protein
MTYTIAVQASTFNFFGKWREAGFIGTFSDFVFTRYPDILDFRAWGHSEYLLTFETEAHYTWFLLQQ